jgi:hypothetical protein
MFKIYLNKSNITFKCHQCLNHAFHNQYGNTLVALVQIIYIFKNVEKFQFFSNKFFWGRKTK